jgi:predicted ATPase
MHGGKEAPTISAGTARLLAMLTAYYALDVRLAQIQMPGLVVIEEPDTALNPWLLRNFVEQLRNYT